ncbi:MAG: hypothetical protein V3U76_16910 [Granulosicoccus sp.]
MHRLSASSHYIAILLYRSSWYSDEMFLFLMLYILAGLLFGLAFFVRGYAAIDPGAAGTSFRVRLLWLPASVVLWPWLLYRWARAS